LAAIASAQVLRYSQAVVGQSSPGQVQVIPLGRGGLVSPYRLQAAPIAIQAIRPIAIRPAVQPIQVIARPAVAQIVRPVAISQPILAAPARISYDAYENEQPAPYAFAFDSEDGTN